ncbi:MAG TPA: peptidylprolyl isomerase [Bryobacteraceae bacterium]|nr:peptidylprolyl isomerase [Bryobacteraceae bacterium]
MKTRLVGAAALLSCSIPVFFGQTVTGPAVRFQFQPNIGHIDVMLLPESAPLTVANFLNYVNKGSFTNSMIHRSVPGFIIQGGGYQWVDRTPVEIPADPAVRNEYSLSNTRGTIAMAKVDGNPDSATNQWFFNLANNASNLNSQNGGFTVFGRLINQASHTVMDRIAAQRVVNAGSPFDQLPLVNYTSGQIQDSNVILVRAVTSLAIIRGASGFGSFAVAAPGSYIEIYGPTLSGETSREWTTADFTGNTAPTSLDEISVTVGGKPAFVSYISPGQVNVQVPADAPIGENQPVVLSYQGRAIASGSLSIRAVAGGLLAPASFKVGDRQYVVAVHPDGTYVSNGSIDGVASAPAIPGETLVLYGVGFGPVNPSSVPIAGQVVESMASITTPIEIKIGDATAPVRYAGLAPGLVGLYQFNLTVPAGVSTGDLPLTVTLAGASNTQTLYIPVRSAQ